MKVTARGHLAAFLALQSLRGAHRKEKAGERTAPQKNSRGASVAGQAELTRKKEGMGFGVFLSSSWGLLIWCL